MIPDEPTWRRIERAHRDLAEAQNAGKADAATKAWRELSDLIEGVGTGEPSLEEQRQEVVEALFEAAKDRNVTAILKWLDLHKSQLEGLDLSALKRDRRDPEGFAIYRHVHRESGKDYVGVTEYGVDRRWVQHIRDASLGSSQPLHQAIREFGPEAFDHDVLERCQTREEANKAERKWIAHFHSNQTGYNLDAGGGVHANEVEPERGPEIESTETSITVAHSSMIRELEDAFTGKVL